MLIGLTSKAELNQVDDKFNYKAHVGKCKKKKADNTTMVWISAVDNQIFTSYTLVGRVLKKFNKQAHAVFTCENEPSIWIYLKKKGIYVWNKQSYWTEQNERISVWIKKSYITEQCNYFWIIHRQLWLIRDINPSKLTFSCTQTRF